MINNFAFKLRESHGQIDTLAKPKHAIYHLIHQIIKLRPLLGLLGILLLFQGCGYHWHQEEDKPTLSVPFIAGDDDGSLTNEIIRTISASNIAQIRHNGNYRLQASFKDLKTDTIGYRRDKQKVDGTISTNIVASEQRKSITLEIAIYQQSSNQIVFGPYTITTEIEYDFIDGDSIQDLVFINPQGIPTTVLPFSLGQLEPVEAAQEASSRPLNQKIARKIAEFVSKFTLFFKE